MPDIVPISGPTEMLGQMPSQFVGKPNLEALWTAVGVPATWLDDAHYWLQRAFTVEYGEGVQLDEIGKRMDQPRDGGPYPVGESDALYRVKLRAALLRNRSHGTAEELRAMVHALFDGLSPVVQIVDTPPAKFVLVVGVSAAPSASLQDALVAFCRAAKAAGVGIAGLAWYTAPTFSFDGFPDPPFKGYDDGTGLVGGFWANYIYP